jgi:hypothetical protein
MATAAAAAYFKSSQHEFNHPTVSGTSVYMDDTGVIDMSNKDNTSSNKQVKTYGSIPHFRGRGGPACPRMVKRLNVSMGQPDGLFYRDDLKANMMMKLKLMRLTPMCTMTIVARQDRW